MDVKKIWLIYMHRYIILYYIIGSTATHDRKKKSFLILMTQAENATSKRTKGGEDACHRAI
jgi:hypothetical protein